MSNYDYIVDILRPHLEIPDRPLDMPEPSAETQEREMQADVAYQDALEEALSGDGPFWNPGFAKGGYDNEQYMAVFYAVRSALRLPCASDETRWRIVQRVINTLGDEYAQIVRDGDA